MEQIQPPLSECTFKMDQGLYNHYTDYISTLPALPNAAFGALRRFEGWQAPAAPLVGAMIARRLFTPKPSDVLLCTFPKCGTTWLKSLLFATAHRNSPRYDPRRYLPAFGAHMCVPYLEWEVYADGRVPDLDPLPPPRLFATHVPHHLLPDSVKVSEHAKIVYLCRDPKDTLVSLWHFEKKISKKAGRGPDRLEESYDRFCDGTGYGGPFWDHVVGYWKASQARPGQVLFMKYEEMMRDPVGELRKMAEFCGFGFSAEEERRGAAEEIAEMCRFESMRGLEVNKEGATGVGGVNNSMLFRRGVVGDWANWLSPEMGQRLDEITESKLRGSGLTF